ncbi:hypothetical protein ACFX12_045483 [Malus domestica]
MASTVRRVRWRVSAFERWRKLGPLCSLKSANISRSLLQKRKPTANPRGQVLLLLLLKGGGEGGHPAEKEISSNGRAVRERRTSISPGKRSSSNANSAATATSTANANPRPGKMVSVPANYSSRTSSSPKLPLASRPTSPATAAS